VRLFLVLAIGIAALSPVDAMAQGPPGRVEVGVGVGLLGGATLGRDGAELGTRAGTDFALFNADSRLSRARELEVRAGLMLTRRYALEVRARLSHPELRTSISGDVEGVPGITLIERLDQYVVDASLTAALERWSVGPVVPFVAAGAGYLRQLHEGQMLIEQGTAYHLGGGARHRMFSRGSGWLKEAGIRGDARVYVFSGGVALRDRPRPHVAASGSFFVVF
jgi:hypothetical protein